MVGIYGIHNKVNDKWYVGQSKDIKKRNNGEFCNLLNGKFHSWGENHHIVNAVKKYGIRSFEWVVLEECEIDKLDEREIFWIKEKDSYKNGYNQTLGGQKIKEKSYKMPIKNRIKKKTNSCFVKTSINKKLEEIRRRQAQMEKYYSLNETADILGVKVRTLREWLKDGSLKAQKYDGKKKWYVSQSEVERLQSKMTEN